MKQLLKFNDLSYNAQQRAIEDYIEGWHETHDEADEFSTSYIAGTLKNREDLYSEDGELIQTEDE